VVNGSLTHDGKKGHWLETQMGIAHNGNNEPDIHGYEMKNETTSGKITFGDWSADEYIFLHGRGKNKTNSVNINYLITRSEFFKLFGKPNPTKNNRLSWSGTPCPTYYGDITTFGQELTIDHNGNIIIMYHFSKDCRENKNELIPYNMQHDGLVIAKWNKENIKKRIENKFNKNGWFKCSTDYDGKYDKIHFGDPINYESWIKLFKDKKIFFDSGMYESNLRPYSQWRSATGVWVSLITESY